jgi:hypothetical protein
LEVTWVDGEEIRFITADVSNTLTVHEDWINPPVSGEDWAVSYILEDVATVTGFNLNSKRGVFEASRVLHIADTVSGDFAFLGVAEGKAIALDNASADALEIQNAGLFAIGYLQGGVPVNGGYIFPEETSSQSTIRFRAQSRTLWYDLQLRAALADVGTTNDTTFTSLHAWRACKFFNLTDDLNIPLRKLQARDLVIGSEVVGTNFVDPGLRLGGANTFPTEFDGITLVNTHGFGHSGGSTEREVRNVVFVGNDRHITIDDGELISVVNPIGWVANSTFIVIATSSTATCKKLTSWDLEIQDVSGTSISGALALVHDEATSRIPTPFPLDNQLVSDSNGEASADILDEEYTNPSGTFTTETFGNFSQRIFKYGFSPFVGPLTLSDFPNGIDLPVTLGSDSAIGATTQPDARENARGMVVNRQLSVDYDGETGGPFTVGDVLRGPNGTGKIYELVDNGLDGTLRLENVVGVFQTFQVIEYDSGSGPIPSIGDRIQGQTSGAEGMIVQIFGTATAGFLVLGRRNETAFTSTGETIDDALSSGTWTATHDPDAPGNHDQFDFEWNVDANSAATKTYTAIYEALAAGMAKTGNGAGSERLLIIGMHPLCYYWDQSGLSYFDNTEAGASEDTGDILVLPSALASNDAFIVGDPDVLFESIHIDVQVAHSTAPTGSWQYWNGSVWTNLSGVVDGTNGFQNTGLRVVSWTIPTDWALLDVAGTVGYYVRWVETVVGTTRPTANRIWTDRVFQDVHAWGRGKVSQLLFLGASGFFTLRNDSLSEGVIVTNATGDTDFFTSDDGTQFNPPQSVTVEVTGVTEGARCIIEADGITGPLAEGTVILSDAANASGVASTTFFGTVPQGVIARARSSGIIAAAIADDGGVLTDETEEGRRRSTTNDVTLFPTSPTVNVDQYYFGGLTQFTKLIVRVGTAGLGTYVLTWEYWNGSWATLTTISADDFKATGPNEILFAAPGNWATTSVSGQGPYYYVRARWTSGTMTTSPIGNNASMNVTKYLPFQQSNTITASGLSVTAVWIVDTIAT